MSLVPSTSERLREEWETVKSLKGKKRWDHIWDYYKIHIIAILTLLAILSYSIYLAANPPPTTTLAVAWKYGPQLMEFSDILSDELTERLMLQLEHERAFVSPMFFIGEPQFDMAMHARFTAMLAARDLDIVIATAAQIEDLAIQGVLFDIRPWLPNVNADLLWATGEDGESRAFAVSLENSALLEKASFIMFRDDDGEFLLPYLGVIINTTQEENVRKAISQLLQ